MERIIMHQHSHISNLKSYCRNRRQTNPAGLSKEQQKIQELITIKTVEFHQKAQLIQMKLNEVKNHVKRTKNRLNNLHHSWD